MKSRYTIWGAVLVAVIAVGSAAHGQTPAASSVAPLCPHRPLSVYFSAGDTVVSPQARALTKRVGETAVACEPDSIDLIARVDGGEGAAAITLALQRLAEIAKELVAAGLPAERIRAVARPAEAGGSSLHQVDMIFRKQDGALAAGDIEPSTPDLRIVPHRRGDAV